MTAKEYRLALEKRGGIRRVAQVLQCSPDRLYRIATGQAPVTRRAELELMAIPELPDWRTLYRLRTDGRFRNRFARVALRLGAAEQDRRFALLAATLPEFRARLGARTRWRRPTGTARNRSSLAQEQPSPETRSLMTPDKTKLS